MPLRTFFPVDPVSAAFVVGLLVWFAVWLSRLRSESSGLDILRGLLARLDGCVEPLRTHQLWRDRQRLQGHDALADPAQFFNTTCLPGPASGGAAIPSIVMPHFRAIFVAGCDESALDAAELNAQTCQEIAGKAERLRSELYLMLLVGLIGTLLALSRLRYALYSVALPPLIWGAFLAGVGGVLWLRLQQRKLAPALAEVRRKTTTLWIPRLYPTVAQRAAQWAVHTLHNAARVTDASAVIEEHAVKFVTAVEVARQAAEIFSGGMREFSHGIDASDRALKDAQTKLAGELSKFADAVGRWGAFESEIRRFYSSAESQQKTFEAMLSGYYNLVRQSTEVLQNSVSEVTAASRALPETITQFGSEMRSAYHAESVELQARFAELVQPILNMEAHLRSLGTPFESASNRLVEFAENLWKLNDTFAREVTRALADIQDGRTRSGSERARNQVS